MEEKEKTASLKDVMKFFGGTSSSQFAKEWKELSFEEKEWFKKEVGRIMEA